MLPLVILPALDESSNIESDSYMAQMNFVERKLSNDGSYDYVPFRDGIIYDGGEMDFYVEGIFSGSRKSVKAMDAVVLLFVDGYIQEFSLEGDEMAMLHNITIQNNETARLRFRCIPTTYDVNAKRHSLIAVILPSWQAGSGNFLRDTAVMAVGREITLNTIHEPSKDEIIKMDTRQKTDWDSSHSELPFKQDGSNTNVIFHCFYEGETNCYLFCDGELLSQEGKYIFNACNQDADMVSYYGISLSESQIGSSLYVLYIPKNYGESAMVERTCNYLWDSVP